MSDELSMIELQEKLCPAPTQRRAHHAPVTIVEHDRQRLLARQQEIFKPQPVHIPSEPRKAPVFITTGVAGGKRETAESGATNLFIRAVPASAQIFRARL